MRYLYRSLAMFMVFFFLEKVQAQQNLQEEKYLPGYISPGYIQGRGTEELDLDDWVEKTSKEIEKARPGAFTSNPEADKQVVRSVYKSVKDKFNIQQFSKDAALKAIFSAWIELAVKGYDKLNQEINYSEDDLYRESIRMGELNIKTEPDGATVMIDNYKGFGKTTTSVWISGGDHFIKVFKEGYAANVEIVHAEALKRTSITIELKSKK